MKSNTIIISIHPCHIEKIFSGEKLYEFRKSIAPDVQNLIIYATAPIKQIVAVIEVDSIITGIPHEVWQITKNQSGLTENSFMLYFNNKDIANAIKFKKIHKLENPKSISIFDNVKSAPQSYIYVNESFTEIEKKLDLHNNTVLISHMEPSSIKHATSHQRTKYNKFDNQTI